MSLSSGGVSCVGVRTTWLASESATTEAPAKSKTLADSPSAEGLAKGRTYTPSTVQTGPKLLNLESAWVVRVVDGDTIVVLLRDKEEKVRLTGVDTPEQGRPYYLEAKRKTEELVGDRTVHMEKDIRDRDHYGRLLRYVYVDNLFVNAELLRQGYATVYTYPPDVKHADDFVELQIEARKAERGLWSLK